MKPLALVTIPTLILVAGVVDDLRSRKIHNALLLSCLPVALIFQFYTAGGMGILNGLGGMGIALALFLPLTFIKALGAGDMKLMMVFGLATGMTEVLYVTFYSFLWGLLLGLLITLFHGRIKIFAKNIAAIVQRKKVDSEKLHSMPYSIALLCGWITYMTIEKTGHWL